jgi:hypothetical protein
MPQAFHVQMKTSNMLAPQTRWHGWYYGLGQDAAAVTPEQLLYAWMYRWGGTWATGHPRGWRFDLLRARKAIPGGFGEWAEVRPDLEYAPATQTGILPQQNVFIVQRYFEEPFLGGRSYPMYIPITHVHLVNANFPDRIGNPEWLYNYAARYMEGFDSLVPGAGGFGHVLHVGSPKSFRPVVTWSISDWVAVRRSRRHAHMKP